jgi:nitrite reductase (NADH) large subunit
MKKWRCKICGYIHEGELPPVNCPVCDSTSEYFILFRDTKSITSSSRIKRVIIIGNGAAGIEAARTIRENDQEVEIIIFSKEKHHFYSRIHLSTFIGDDTPKEKIIIYKPDWYEDRKIEVILNQDVKEILPEINQIKISNGKTFEYDKLIIATGATPLLPPIVGIEKKGIFTLRTLENAEEIRSSIKKIQSVVVLGGGILGIEAAASINKKGIKVHLVESADYLMHKQLDKEGAGVLQNKLEKSGIKVHTSTKVTKFLGQIILNGVKLDNGENVQTQLALISAGIRPRIKLAKNAKIKVNKGILINERMQTNFPNIYAAGDVAEFNNKIYGIWPAAVDQGIIAGECAINKESIYNGTTPLYILKIADIELTTLGQKQKTTNKDQEIIHLNKKSQQYIKLIHNENFLIGAITIDISGTGFRLEKLIKKGVSIRNILPDLKAGNWDVLKQK